MAFPVVWTLTMPEADACLKRQILGACARSLVVQPERRVLCAAVHAEFRSLMITGQLGSHAICRMV